MPERDMPITRTDFSPITVADFYERTGINLSKIRACESITWIVSPRDITNISDVMGMSNEYRNRLLASIGLAAHPSRKIYEGLSVHQFWVDPSSLMLGQKFVYRPNYISIVEGFRTICRGFEMIKGFTQYLACLIIGTDDSGKPVLGHYLPPIVEQHGTQWILMDGVHRNYLAQQAGVPIECIVIHGVTVPFPCTPHEWDEVTVVEEKPNRAEDRYWDLDRKLFRDTKLVGIDG
jgi:hypothetical protein